jgi:hypothetical protein
MTSVRRLIVIVTGEEVYLVPKTIGCASACWKQPKVTVVSTQDRPIIAVRLPDDLGGEVIRTHEDNLTGSRPAQPRPRPFKARSALSGAEEIPLW